jgi:type IV pilus assembly protein PilP
MHAAGLVVLIALLGTSGPSRVLRTPSVLASSAIDAPQAPAAPTQAPAPPAAAPAAPTAPATSAQAPNAAAPADASKPPVVPENYTYEPAGRRDPFVSLLGTGTEGRSTSRKGEGFSGMTVAEISVRGVLQSRSGLIAMVQGPDNRTYIVHPGDKLLDGAIKSITPQGLVIEQAVNDPLSVVKQREVRKLLRGLEDAK